MDWDLLITGMGRSVTIWLQMTNVMVISRTLCVMLNRKFTFRLMFFSVSCRMIDENSGARTENIISVSVKMIVNFVTAVSL